MRSILSSLRRSTPRKRHRHRPNFKSSLATETREIRADVPAPGRTRGGDRDFFLSSPSGIVYPIVETVKLSRQRLFSTSNPAGSAIGPPLEASHELVKGSLIANVEPTLFLLPAAEVHYRSGVEELLLTIDRRTKALDRQDVIVGA